jgi:A/G-specific adenine glycosylase
MLQQTQAARVAPAFARFLAAFPTLAALAAAPRADVITAWGGLGYNRRAVALSAAARLVVGEHAGRLPSDPDALRSLPGVGPYTAAAVASIAFGEPVAAVDTNVRRLVARVRVGAEADEVPPGRIRTLAEGWVDRRAPGEWNQAVMDLGREVCRPVPRCDRCPLAAGCRFAIAGRAPRRASPRQGAFEGSSRQLRGAIVRVLRERRSATLGALAAATGFAPERVVEAVGALHREGLVAAGQGALAGRSKGRIRLAG